MTDMLGKLFTTRTGNRAANTVAALVGIILVITVDSTRTGTIVFLAVTALESGAFSLIYGLRSDWRKEPAARAVFWAVLAYFGVAAHLLTMYIWPRRFWWTDDLRELLYLGLAVAGLNLVLTVVRLLGRRVYRRVG
jgi:hypothetical protein